MSSNKFDADCFALVRAHQHGITIHNQDVMTERESGVISFIIYYYGGGGWGVGKGELGNTKVSIVYSIRMGGRTMLGEGTSIELPLPFCIKPDKLIAVDNLNLRIDCPPLNNE